MKSNTQNDINKLLRDNIDHFLKELEHSKISRAQVSTNWGTLDNVYNHYQNSLIFNRRLQFNPFVIVYCESLYDVHTTFKAAKNNKLPFRVRAGGHDHEGECTGTNVILIDVSRMNYPNHGHKKVFIGNEKIAHIRPGIRFKELTSELAKYDVMIPHGTCASVGIAGFTMGGGWGPWTRKYGMCCERLVGATIILGDGTIQKIEQRGATHLVYELYEDGSIKGLITQGSGIHELLWALRGGGGMSYGIITEFQIKTFDLPRILHRFTITWNPYNKENPDQIDGNVPALDILKKWEEIITADNTSKLIGTNLKVSARPWNDNIPVPYETINLNCQFNGYWEGDEQSLNYFIDKNFTGVLSNYSKEIAPATGADFEHKSNYGNNLMSSWDRESFNAIKQILLPFHLKGTPLQPDLDQPAPHKITSRLVNKEGLNSRGLNGHQRLIESLCSSLLTENNRKNLITNYVTLGAIVGDFYKRNPYTDSAFPYNDKLYTIQYQCWWEAIDGDMPEVIKKAIEDRIKEFQNNVLYDYTNRALDWIEASRDFHIPNTSGAFISFKDSSIPTKTYFGNSYNDLKRIKETYSRDFFNHFRSRKTII